MSSRLGPFATVTAKIDQFQKCNSRVARSLLKIGTSQDSSELHAKIELDRQQSLRLALEIKDLLEACPNTTMRTQYAHEFQNELSRFQSTSEELKKKDEQLNKKATQPNAGNQKKQQNARSSNSNYNAQPYNEALLASGQKDSSADGDDLFSQLQMTEEEQLQQQQGDLVAELLLTEQQDQSIDIAQMEQRRQEIFQIEQDVQTIATMFKDLQTLVHEQGEQLDVIEETIIQTQENTEAGYAELESAEEHQIASGRNLRWVLFLGIAALIAVAIVILVLYNKSTKKP